MCLIPLIPMHIFSTPWKRQKTLRFLMFSGGRERVHWKQMGLGATTSFAIILFYFIFGSKEKLWNWLGKPFLTVDFISWKILYHRISFSIWWRFEKLWRCNLIEKTLKHQLISRSYLNFLEDLNDCLAFVLFWLLLWYVI